jgi:2-haloacid dehalogenase
MNTQKQTKPAIVFDLGAVLIDWDRRHLYKKMFNGRAAELNYFLDNVCTLAWNAEMDAGRPFTDAVAAKIAEFPQYEPYIAAYHSRWEEMIVGPINDTVKILSELIAAGYPTAALSNWSAETYPKVRAEFEFLDWFDEIVISGHIEVNKPDPAIYQTLLERIGRQPQDCIFIDDSPANIQAARQLGFRAIHFQSPAQLRQDLAKMGVLN